MSIINKIRESLIQEALNSPNLLSDIAGFEQYISESYNSRTIMELLQNADDAEADKICFELIDNETLIVSNNGRIFSDKDFESICRSANSNKVRGKNIGYRGIGFKSVLNFAKEISILSNDINFKFSKELTKNLLTENINVPLIRIPHPISIIDYQNKFGDKINSNVTFIFEKLNIKNIEFEIETFERKSLLFLKNIKTVEIISPKFYKKIEIKRTSVSDSLYHIQILENDKTEEWLVSNLNNIGIGFFIYDNKIVKLEKNTAFFYSFLPTEEKTGLGVIINGDLSTDPSRKMIILDETTLQCLNEIACALSDIIILALKNESIMGFSSTDFLNALIPHDDPSLNFLKSQNSSTIIIKKLKDNLANKMDGFVSRPSWFNGKDFFQVVDFFKIEYISHEFEILNNSLLFFRYIGIKDLSEVFILQFLENNSFSILGTSEVLALLIRNYYLNKITNLDFLKTLNLIFASDNKIYSASNFNTNLEIKTELIELISEKNIGISEVSLFFNKVFQINIKNKVETLVNSSSEVESLKILKPAIENNNTFIKILKKWRRAEEYVYEYFKFLGYNVKDVSKQNLGYDLEVSLNETIKYIEVKMLDYFGKPFTMTNNEWIVANSHTDKYSLALVKIANSFVEIIFIEKPTEILEFQRKSLQWVFECSEYHTNQIIKVELE